MEVIKIGIPEIIWKDKETGQRFVIDDDGEKIFIMEDGTRVYESNLILDELAEQYKDEELKLQEAEEAAILEMIRREEEEEYQRARA